jgi:2-dehydro-3-deoxygluconokinase
MNSPFRIPTEGALDLLALGALVIRLDPGIVPIHKARSVDIHVSGAEYNVAANLADCFRLRTAVASAMVDHPIGALVADRVRAAGVRGIYRDFGHDGVTGPNIATVYSDRGHGVRGPSVSYNRANEAAALLRPGDFDWDAIFADGVRWFHTGGLFTALSDTAPDLIIEAMTAARAHGAVVSFDLNFREKLWQARGGEATAQATFRRIARHVDVLVGNEEDLQRGLGLGGPAEGGAPAATADAFAAMVERLTADFPGIRVAATSLRDVHSTNRHTWAAAAWIDGQMHVTPTRDLDIYDRVGGGDGFASGLFYGLLAGETPERALRLGWAHGALLTTFPGDTSMATLEQVRALAEGGSARIAR